MFKGRKFINLGIIFVVTFFVLALFLSFISYRTNYIIELFILILLSIIISVSVLKVKKSKENFKYDLLNKELIRLINLLVIIVAIFVIALTPFFQSTWFYIRHIVIFILIAFLLCFNGYLIGIKAIKSYPGRANVLKYISLGATLVGLLVFGNLQLFYINNYEIPPLLGCSYYDDYGNLIYNSQIAGSCPILENIVKTSTEEGSKLSFTVHEEIFRYDDKTFDFLVKDKYDYFTNIEYHYDKFNRVIYYQISLSIMGYGFDQLKQEYTLFKITDYSKTIENTYEENRMISDHKVVNKESNGNHEFQILSYNYDIQYISELKQKEDSNDYKIEVNRLVRSEKGDQTNLLYSIDVVLDKNHDYFYIIKKNEKNEYVVLRVDERNAANDWYVISRDYRSSVYERIRLEKQQNFENHKTLSNNKSKLYTNKFTRYQPYFGNDVDFNNSNIIRTNTDGLFNQEFFNFTNMIENTEYGFKINHYHMQRKSDLSYNKYPSTIQYSIDYPNNPISIELQKINDYESSLFYPDFYKMELVYQDNPLLMKSYIENLFNK